MFILVLLVFCCGNRVIFSEKCRNWSYLATDGNQWHCCNNHEEINGNCVACMPGYFSEDGEPCQECRYGFYGSYCAEICKCIETESCHHIEGCIKRTDTAVIVETESSTANAKIHYRITLATRSPFLSGTIHEGNNYTTGSSLPSVTSHEENSFPDLSKRELVVYSICIGGFTCLLLLFFCRGRCTVTVHRNPSVLLDSENARNNVPVCVLSVGYTEGVYETIDESNMIDASLEVIVPITVETPSSVESTESEHSHSLLTNEYLNPYQPMVPDPEKHVYDFATHVTTEDYSELTENNSVYWNPSYQQTVPYSAYQHCLSIKADVYCFGSSTSDENEKESEYRQEKDLEQIEYEDETSTEEVKELLNHHSHQCFKGSISSSEIEMQIECTSISYKIPVDDINNDLPVAIFVEGVPCDYATHSVAPCEP